MSDLKIIGKRYPIDPVFYVVYEYEGDRSFSGTSRSGPGYSRAVPSGQGFGFL